MLFRIGVVALAALIVTAAPLAAKKPSKAAKNRALLIAVGSYADEGLKASAPSSSDRDLETMQALLTSRLGFAKEEIKILRDKDATKSAILDAMTDWLRPDRKQVEERREDEEKIRSGKLKPAQVKALRRKWRKASRGPKRSFLYFAGLGHFRRDLNGDEADGYDETIIPYDARVFGSGRDAVIDRMITDDEFSEALAELEGRNVTVLLDTSHSGWVTRSDQQPSSAPGAGRVPDTREAHRTLYEGGEAARQKGEGGFVETRFSKGRLTVWSAAAPSQTALVDTEGERPVGAFTKLFAQALAGDAADANGNGFISNSELLLHLAKDMAAFCEKHRTACELGLTPVLEPPGVYGRRAAPGKQKRRWKLTLSQLNDYLVKGNTHNITLVQEPASPVEVGETSIQFKATAPRDGHLILLSLTDKGRLLQLYPNRFVKSEADDDRAAVKADQTIVVPEDHYGLKLTATDPAKGHVLAVFTPDPVALGANVMDRSIGDIPRSEALKIYLPKLAAALASPLTSGPLKENTGMAEWSVATLPFEIVPKPKPAKKADPATNKKGKSKPKKKPKR